MINEPSGLVHRRHRRGKRRRTKLRLAVRVGLSIAMIGAAAGLSAGIIHVIERPLSPFKGMVEPVAKRPAVPEHPLAPIPAESAHLEEPTPDPQLQAAAR